MCSIPSIATLRVIVNYRLSYRHRRPIVAPVLVLVALSLDPDLFPLFSLSRLSFRGLSSKPRDPLEVDRYDASSRFPLKRLDASADNNRDALSRKLAGPDIAHFIATATGRPVSAPEVGRRRLVPAGGGSFRARCSVAGSRESSSGTFAPWRGVITRPLIDDNTAVILIVRTPLACLHRMVRRRLLYESSPNASLRRIRLS